MRDLISMSPVGYHEGKKGGLVPMARMMRLGANKYSKRYMELSKIVDENNKNKTITKLPEGGFHHGLREEGKEARVEGVKESGEERAQEEVINQQTKEKEVIE